MAGTKQGVGWAVLNNTNGFSKKALAAHTAYVKAQETVLEQAKELAEQLNEDWSAKYPDGKDGKDCKFNVLNGKVLYALVEHKNGKNKSTEGDDVNLFA